MTARLPEATCSYVTGIPPGPGTGPVSYSAAALSPSRVMCAFLPPGADRACPVRGPPNVPLGRGLLGDVDRLRGLGLGDRPRGVVVQGGRLVVRGDVGDVLGHVHRPAEAELQA